MKVFNAGAAPQTLDDGRSIAPGEQAEISAEDLETPHNQVLLEAGLIGEVIEREEETPKKASDRSKGGVTK